MSFLRWSWTVSRFGQVYLRLGGLFATGRPEGDNGLSGKTLVVDAVRAACPNRRRRALSGKDLFKVDRAGAILAGRIAKAVVLTGSARECRATLAIFPGETAFRIVSLVDDTGRRLDSSRWAPLFDRTLAVRGGLKPDAAA